MTYLITIGKFPIGQVETRRAEECTPLNLSFNVHYPQLPGIAVSTRGNTDFSTISASGGLKTESIENPNLCQTALSVRK